MRFVVDLVPADDRLGEETVLADDGATGNVALVEIEGTISTAGPTLPFAAGRSTVEVLDEALEKAAEDPRVKAVILRVDSRGGTVTASDMMYGAVKRFRAETGKPVVTLFDEYGASGAYYLACASNEIIAHPTTITGSIGVIFQSFNVSDGMRRIGIFAQTITSGPNKAMGSMFDPPNEQHRALMQGIVDGMYARFKGIVVDARPGIAESDVPSVTDGRAMTGEEAARVGVVDATGDLRDAFAAAKRLAGLPAARLVRYAPGARERRDPAWYSEAPAGAERTRPALSVEISGEGLEPGFYYIWAP
jgi:protease-4